MKKLIPICFLLANSFYSNAQTKEETISWLQEKLDKYLIGFNNVSNITKINLININTCEITIDSDMNGSQTITVFPTAGINIDKEGFSYDRQVIMFKDLTKNTKSFHSLILKFYFEEGEKDLIVRIQKALDHLATFCPTKEETF